MWRLPTAELISGRTRAGHSEARATPLYLHVGPSGDCWTDRSIFAAKHLQPDYVKSVALEGELPAESILLVEVLEERQGWAQEIYDSGEIPDALREHILKLASDDENAAR